MRIQVNLSDEMIKKLDGYCEMLGVSRSALCSVFIGQGALGYDQAFKIVNNTTKTMNEMIKSDVEVDGQIELEDILNKSKIDVKKRQRKTSK